MSAGQDFGKWIAEYCPYQKELFDDNDRRYMILEPELKPLRQDPFWTKQGKRTKGKRGKY